MNFYRNLRTLLASIALFLGIVVPGLAQTTGEVELVGIVEAMTLNTVTINEQEIDVSTAEFNTSIEVGAIVQVEGTLNTDGMITARELNPVDEGTVPGEAELIGILESFDGTTMVVNGQTIDISIAGFNGAIRVGELVKVHATATDAGTWLTREVEPFVADENDSVAVGEFEIIGTLEEIGDGFIVVSGQVISIVDAEVKDPLVPGVLVKVHLSEVNGELLAREVENANTDDNNNPNANDNANVNQNDNANQNANASQNDNTNQNDNDNQNANDNDNQNDNTSTEPEISAQEAINIVLEIYPNTSIIAIELDDKFGGTLVWEIHTSHGLELNIDAQSGVILTIENDNNNTNDNSNINGNDNSNNNVNNNSNNNANTNGNDNDDDDDNSGMGSDDDDDDDNSGMGSNDD